MDNIKVLVIDDEKNILESVKMVLGHEGYLVETAADGIAGIDLFKRTLPDIVLLDVRLPGQSGMQVLRTLKDIQPLVEVIMISGHSGIEEAVESSRLGAFDFLEKPLSRDKLLLTVRNAAEKLSLRKENYTLRSQSERKYELIGASPAMERLRETVRRVARSESTVLITGESGTGKELIARQIHQQSARVHARFVQVNCAAIPDELIESELFGHEKGSFTGAHEKKIGKFESAHRGTIFLDEIADLSLKAQAKVLRVLEEGEVQPVGSAEVKKVNVRVIAATNKDLAEEIRRERFREDLFFRLNVVPLHSAPLRERPGDVPLLVDHFINYFSDENNYRRRRFSQRALQRMVAYEWKGNVRELRNLVERLLIMSEGNEIDVDDLPEHLRPRAAAQPDFVAIRLWKDFKQVAEKAFLEGKLKEFQYNIARTAREIDLPRSNLYKKIAALGIMLPQPAADEEPPPSS